MTVLIILSFSSTFHATPATADSSVGAPVTIILSGIIQAGNVTSGVIKVNSGFVIVGGLDNVVCQCIPPGYNGSDLDCICTSNLEERNINATTISLGGILVLHLAGLYTLDNNELLSVVFGVGPPFPGSTAITEGVDGPVDFLINAQGNVHVNGTSVDLTATGTVTSDPSVSLCVCPCKTVVDQGYNLPINLTITSGGYLSQIPHIVVYLNTTIIGTETNINLTNGATTILSLTYNTSSFSLGKYNVTAFPRNPSAPSSIVLTIPGDLDGNFQVQLADLVILAKAYSSKPSSSNWNPNADIDGNNAVGLSDLVILAQHYGQHYP
jgi:hypothetical protein